VKGSVGQAQRQCSAVRLGVTVAHGTNGTLSTPEEEFLVVENDGFFEVLIGNNAFRLDGGAQVQLGPAPRFSYSPPFAWCWEVAVGKEGAVDGAGVGGRWRCGVDCGYCFVLFVRTRFTSPVRSHQVRRRQGIAAVPWRVPIHVFPRCSAPGSPPAELRPCSLIGWIAESD
jgi:hypothetical protein